MGIREGEIRREGDSQRALMRNQVGKREKILQKWNQEIAIAGGADRRDEGRTKKGRVVESTLWSFQLSLSSQQTRLVTLRVCVCVCVIVCQSVVCCAPAQSSAISSEVLVNCRGERRFTQLQVLLQC